MSKFPDPDEVMYIDDDDDDDEEDSNMSAQDDSSSTSSKDTQCKNPGHDLWCIGDNTYKTVNSAPPDAVKIFTFLGYKKLSQLDKFCVTCINQAMFVPDGELRMVKKKVEQIRAQKEQDFILHYRHEVRATCVIPEETKQTEQEDFLNLERFIATQVTSVQQTLELHDQPSIDASRPESPLHWLADVVADVPRLETAWPAAVQPTPPPAVQQTPPPPHQLPQSESFSVQYQTPYDLVTRRQSEQAQIKAQLDKLSRADMDEDERASQIKQLRMLAFVNPGKFMEDFDPETSAREMKKMNRRLYKGSSVKKNQLYDEKGVLLINGKNICDCLEPDCQGCHFPCPKCRSTMCGGECRCNRRWVYEQVEVEGTGKTLMFSEG